MTAWQCGKESKSVGVNYIALGASFARQARAMLQAWGLAVPWELGWQQVGGEGCAPGTLPSALQRLSGGNLLCLLPCSLHAHVIARDKQSSHYCITQYSKKCPS